MQKILSSFNGKMLGNKYCFERNGERFEAQLDYSDAVDYHWRDQIIIRQVDGKFWNVFKFKKGKYRDGNVIYHDDVLGRFVTICDFPTLICEISDWIDFVTAKGDK